MANSTTKTTTVQNLNTTKMKTLQVEISRCNGKICAYLRVNKVDDAKLWARNLQGILEKHGLL